MKMSAAFYGCMFVLGLSACGGGGGSKGGGSGPKNDAIHKLSATHQANLEAWKNRAIKSCDSSEALGIDVDHQLEQAGIDSAALIKGNGNSIIFSDASNWVILNGYNSFFGTANTSTDKSININGKAYHVNASTKREGSLCTLFLYGEKIYETRILQSFSIGAHYFNGKAATAKAQNLNVKPLGVNGHAEVTQSGLLNLVNESIRPSKQAQSFIAGKLGIKTEQAEKLFTLGGYGVADSAFRIGADSSAIWSNSESGNLIASAGSLNKLFDGNLQEFDLELRLAVPQFDFGNVKNTSDDGNLALTFKISVEKNGNDFNSNLIENKSDGIKTYSLAEAQTCAQLRARAYVNSANVANQVVPSVRTLLGTCNTFHSGIEEDSYRSGLFKSLLSEVLKNVIPSPKVTYGGWDLVLGRLAVDAINLGKDINVDLDPNQKTEIISFVSLNLETLKTEIEKSKNMLDSKESVYQMGLNWSTKGQKVLPARIAQIIRAVDNAVDTFKVSSERLLNLLAFDPNTNDVQISFALNLDMAYKSEAVKALNIANSLSYSEFTSDVFNQVLQKQISVSELKDWSDRLSSIKSEIVKYKSLEPVKGSLVNSTIAGLKKGELTSAELPTVYASLNNAIDPFFDSTKQLTYDLAQSFSAQKEALSFAASLSADYKKLAIAVRDQSRLAEFETWGIDFFRTVLQKRPAIELLRQWNSLWVSAVAFIQKEKATVADGMMASSAEWNRKKVVELAVKEIWSAQDFTTLETIASVAKFKSSCTNYKDSSSLADCVGLSLFSKAPKKFLDANLVSNYRALALDYNRYMTLLSDFGWTSLRWTLLDTFFDISAPIWSRCDATGFASRTNTLRGQIKTIAVETDQFKKWQLESQIKETIKNCP